MTLQNELCGTYTHLSCTFEFEFENENLKMVERKSMEAERGEVVQEVREVMCTCKRE